MCDEIGSELRKDMAGRGKLNFIGFDTKGGPSVDGTYPANLSPCMCSTRLIYKGKNILECIGCGNQVSIQDKEDENKPNKRSRKGGKQGELFAISQTMTKKKPEHLEEAERLFDGVITSYEERVETPTYDRTAEDGVISTG